MGVIKIGSFHAEWGKKSVNLIGDKNIVISSAAADLGTFMSVFKTGGYAEANMLKLFASIPEVFAPVDRIADAVASGKYSLRKIQNGERTDIEVTNNKLFNRLIDRPNWQETFYDLLYSAVVYELVCGNRYFYPFTASSLPSKFDSISALWLLPPQYVTIMDKSARTNLFVSTSPADVIDKYHYSDGYDTKDFTPEQVTHEAYLNLGHTEGYSGSRFKGMGPLQAAEKPMSNLVAVYEARNVIYYKRGALGWLVSEKGDADGREALTNAEKKEAEQDFNSSYGITEGKNPIGITRIPLKYIQTAMSIKDLEPFAECEADADAIRNILRVPREAMAGKEGSTFENQSKAMANFYRDVIIPKAESLAQTLSKVLFLDKENLYIHADFSHIEVLQEDKKLKAETDWRNNETARVQFMHGQITLNDWRVMYGRDEINDAIYKKTVFQMTPEEFERVKEIINAKSNSNEQQAQSGQAQS